MSEKGKKEVWQIIGLTAAVAGLFYYAYAQVKKVSGITGILKDRETLMYRSLMNEMNRYSDTPVSLSYVKRHAVFSIEDNMITGSIFDKNARFTHQVRTYI